MDERGIFADEAIAATSRACTAGVIERLHARGLLGAGSAAAHEAALAAEVGMLLRHLGQALACGVPAVFADYCRWLRESGDASGVPAELVGALLACLAEEVVETLPQAVAADAAAVVRRALDAAPAEGLAAGELSGEGPQRELARRILLAMLEGRADDALRLAMDAMDAGASAELLLEDVLRPTLVEVGRMWQRGEIHVGEEHQATRIAERIHAAIAARAPRAAPRGRRLLAATVGGELHELGLRIVATRFELAGWDVVMLGASVPATDLVRSAEDFAPDLVALSVQIALHLGEAARAIAALRTARPALPILVGGGLLGRLPDLGAALGADAQAESAAAALAAAERLLPRR